MKKTKRISWVLALLCLLLGMGIVTACRAPDKKSESFINYKDLAGLSFDERFGTYEAQMYAEVTFTKDLVSYELSSAFSENEEAICTSAPLGTQEWEDLTGIMQKYNLLEWKHAGEYTYTNFGGSATNLWLNRDAEYVRQGDFFSLNPMNVYLGIDQNELTFRTAYQGNLRLAVNEDLRAVTGGNDYYQLYTYEGYGEPREFFYGVPSNYNEFRQELWDFVIQHTGGIDWRTELDQTGRELMYQVFPYMTELKSDESIYQNIRYFSIMESYGGKDAGPRVLFIYDGGSRTFNYLYPYVTRIAVDMYSAVENGAKFSYLDTTVSYFDLIPIIDLVTKYMGLGTIVDEDSSGLDDLLSLLEKYQVLEWEPNAGETFYSGTVKEGDFFNIENLIDVEDENEKTFRSSYDVLINIICSDGTYREIRLQNGNMPQTYNQFHTELWDLILEYSYRNQLWRKYERYEISGFSEAVLAQNEQPDNIMLRRIKEMGWDEFVEQQDWRHAIDEEGYQYMVLKYPYLNPDPNNP